MMLWARAAKLMASGSSRPFGGKSPEGPSTSFLSFIDDIFNNCCEERIAAEKRAEGIVGSTDGAAESATEATSGEVEEEKKADSSVNQQELIQESNEYVQFLPVMSCTA